MTQQTPKPIIALDIDDVVANTIDAVHLWANNIAGAKLTKEDYRTNEGDYWNYYEQVWERHGLSDKLSFSSVLETMTTDQSNIAVVEGARESIQELKSRYDFVFITSRPPYHKDATRLWIDEHIDPSISVYMAYNPVADREARSKGEICADLGVSILIDDNVDNCQSAIDYGVDALLFGTYGWNQKAPAHMKRYDSWKAIGAHLLHEA
jgi:5'' nucleotidase, deoxy (Pyrimidine), cytosolic type C protein (NT5C).